MNDRHRRHPPDARLTKEFRGFVAVRRVSLRVRRHTIHALIGPNGAGKTTFFNLLTRFLRPSSGQILYRGIDITRRSPAQVARLGLVRSFQISAVFPRLPRRCCSTSRCRGWATRTSGGSRR